MNKQPEIKDNAELQDRALNALRRLYEAADVYVACQDGAPHEECGLVQPITVKEGNELISAQSEALEVLQAAERDGWVYSEKSANPGH